MVVPVGLYDQGSTALGILRSRRKWNPRTLKEGILIWREKVEQRMFIYLHECVIEHMLPCKRDWGLAVRFVNGMNVGK